MRIDRVIFENYRGIRHLDLDFSQHGNVVVLAGLNGCGKTTVLDGLAMVLGELAYRWYGTKRIPFSTSDIHNDSEEGKIEITIDAVYSAVSNFQYGYHRSRAVNSRLKILKEASLKQALQAWQKEMTWDIEANSDPVLYLPATNRPTGESFLNWLQERINYENALRANNPQAVYPLLEAVRQAILSFADIAVKPNLEQGKVLIRFEKSGVQLAFEQLSDGEQRMVSLVGNMARQFAKHLDTDAEALDFPGIVLIDEVALHLHPRWQQDILTNLTRTFPRVQFIVSSHAPLVLSSVSPQDILLLKREEGDITVSRPNQSYGKDTNWILEEIMQADTRTGEMSEEIEAIEAQIEAGELTQAKAQLEALLARIGDDAELNTKLALIRRKEIIGR